MLRARLTSVPILVAGAILLGVAPASGAAPPMPPLRLTLRVDRPEYYQREPVYADWTLSNEGRKPLNVPGDAALRRLHFEYRLGNGPWVRSNPRFEMLDDTAPLLFSLRQGHSRSAFSNLLIDFWGFGVLGTYKIRAVCRTGLYRDKDDDNYQRVTIISNEVTFKIVEAKGKEAQALKIINDAIPYYPATPYDPERFKDPEEGRRDQMRRDQENLKDVEVRRNRWQVNQDISHEMMRRGKSARFIAAARLYVGYTFNDPTEPKGREEAIEYLQEVRESKASSRFMRGLAGVALLRWKLLEKGDRAKKEAKELASQLLKDYPDTIIAQETQKLLDQQKPKK